MDARKYPFEAVWLSPSSISDFDKCPRLYYLHNVYRNPLTRRKIQVANPYISLGAAVHRTIEKISTLPKNTRLLQSLIQQFEETWIDVSGKIGGYVNDSQEARFKDRGRLMVARIQESPGPLSNYALKVKEKIPSMWLSEEDLLVLCGVIDWIEVLPDDTLHIIDFKTGKGEQGDSLQLPIYVLLAQEKFKRRITKVSYWYVDRFDSPTAVEFPNTDGLVSKLVEKGKAIKQVRFQKNTLCPDGGCRFCEEYEQIIKGNAKYVGVEKVMNKDMYIVGV